jgi:GT2 family glycosyltransferase
LVEWIVFIDDDEFASEQWLGHLLACQRVYGCDVVSGPVIEVLPEGAPEWIDRGRFFKRGRFATGTKRNRASSNNTLVRRSALLDMDPMFDDRGALAGGADTLLFRRMHLEGRVIVWCDEAIVYEDIPPSRACRAWILSRAFRVGANIADHERTLRGPITGRCVALGIAIVRFLQGAFLLIPSLIVGRHSFVTQQRWIAYAAGLVSGIFGVSYNEYRRSHGE